MPRCCAWGTRSRPRRSGASRDPHSEARSPPERDAAEFSYEDDLQQLREELEQLGTFTIEPPPDSLRMRILNAAEEGEPIEVEPLGLVECLEIAAENSREYRRQRELMTRVVAECHVVITTAAIPGKQAPILVTAEMVAAMAPGSVIVDLAAERGGNCELTRANETVVEHGVTILGPVNLPATVPYHASEMYSRNMTTFLKLLAGDGRVNINLEDESIRDTLVTHEGNVVNPRLRELLGLEPLPTGDAIEH